MMKKNVLLAVFVSTLFFISGNCFAQYSLIQTKEVSEDATAKQSEPGTIHNGTTELRVQKTNSDNEQAYLKFDISDLPAGMDSLLIQVYGSQQTSGYTVLDHFYIEAYAISDNSWSETTLTWNNKPALGDLLGTFDVAGESAWHMVGVTDFTNQQKDAGETEVSIALVAKDETPDSYVWFSDKSWRDATLSLYLKEATISGPDYSPRPGQFVPLADGTMKIALNHRKNADIYYTTDGLIPTDESNLYADSITIDSTTTIKAIAYIDGEKTKLSEGKFVLGNQTSFDEEPFILPDDVLFFTKYDNGGQDVAYYNPQYHDVNNANSVRGNLYQYRNLYSTDDSTRLSGGFEEEDPITIDAIPNMGYASADDGTMQWVEWTVDNTSEWYDISLTYWKANDGGAEVGLYLLDRDEKGFVDTIKLVDHFTSFENPGFWSGIDNRTDVSIATGVYMPTGEHVLRFMWYERAVNVSTITFNVSAPNPYQSTGVALDKNSLVFERNDLETSQQLNATISNTTPGLDITDSIIEWSSTHPDVASVDQDGLVTAKDSGQAIITVKTAYGWIDRCTVDVGSTVFVENSVFAGLKVYPNPVSDNIHVILPENNDNVEIQLFNILGKPVLTKKISNNTRSLSFSVNKLQPGLYFMNIRIDDLTKTKKIVVK